MKESLKPELEAYALKGHFAALNLTNAIPKRVHLISSELSLLGSIEQICWERFDRGNAPPDAHLIQAGSSLTYLFKLAITLIRGHFKAYLFDDMRLLPLVAIIGKIKGAKLIYNRQEVPTLDASRALTKLLRLPKSWSISIAEAVETFFGRWVDLVISIPLSESGSERLAKWGQPLVTMMNVPEKANAALPRRPSSRSADEPAMLIYSGAVSLENGLLSYLRLVRRLSGAGGCREVRLLLIGRLWKSSAEALQALIRQESCEGLVEYREWVPYDELMVLLSSADIGLAMTDPGYEKYAHMGDGASRKVFTYMAAGVPVIAGGVFGKVIAEERAGHFVEYDDVDAMFAAAQSILSDPAEALAMSERAQSAILNKYNWEIERGKLIGLLREVTS